MTALPADWPPPWAVACGDDPYGLWATFRVGEERQRMRWIAPGEFWMGSPEDEEGNEDECPRHRVRISRGFWLADTACTQALWLAVVGGDNPSRFADDPQAPVDQVSCDDVQGFLSRLSAQLGDGADVVLPTEAQWEYACRAGTETAYAFGATVSTDQVNFNGNHPYAEAVKGVFREHAVPVKVLPCNRSGLYQMHGNVWEWCADAQRNYATTALKDGVLVDPVEPGPGDYAHRAVRGGSWADGAANARSASRGVIRRDDRIDFLGFRVALRS